MKCPGIMERFCCIVTLVKTCLSLKINVVNLVGVVTSQCNLTSTPNSNCELNIYQFIARFSLS